MSLLRTQFDLTLSPGGNLSKAITRFQGRDFDGLFDAGDLEDLDEVVAVVDPAEDSSLVIEISVVPRIDPSKHIRRLRIDLGAGPDVEAILATIGIVTALSFTFNGGKDLFEPRGGAKIGGHRLHGFLSVSLGSNS